VFTATAGLGTGCGCGVGNGQLGHGWLGARPAVEKGRGRGGLARDDKMSRVEWAGGAGSVVRLGFGPEAD
jgi:hypothetical protein